ncbi:hypothetical protein FHG87_022406 [Trinorchestia longiramus]|nr:hypothetical protein FHG87_022406 [Trinorchestia longiramus]
MLTHTVPSVCTSNADSTLKKERDRERMIDIIERKRENERKRMREREKERMREREKERKREREKARKREREGKRERERERGKEREGKRERHGRVQAAWQGAGSMAGCRQHGRVLAAWQGAGSILQHASISNKQLQQCRAAERGSMCVLLAFR